MKILLTLLFISMAHASDDPSKVLLRALSNGQSHISCSYHLVRGTPGFAGNAQDKFSFSSLKIKVSKSIHYNFLIFADPEISEVTSSSGQAIQKALFVGSDSSAEVSELEVLFDQDAKIISIDGRDSESNESIFICN